MNARSTRPYHQIAQRWSFCISMPHRLVDAILHLDAHRSTHSRKIIHVFGVFGHTKLLAYLTKCSYVSSKYSEFSPHFAMDLSNSQTG